MGLTNHIFPGAFPQVSSYISFLTLAQLRRKMLNLLLSPYAEQKGFGLPEHKGSYLLWIY